MSDKPDKVTPVPYEQHYFTKDLLGVGIAWNHNRVWFCINGLSVMRAMVHDGKLVVHYDKPESIEELEQ